MTPRHVLVVVLVLALLAMTVQPPPAEAIEPFTAIAIAGAAVAVVILIAYLVVANVAEQQRADITPAAPLPAGYATPSAPRLVVASAAPPVAEAP